MVLYLVVLAICVELPYKVQRWTRLVIAFRPVSLKVPPTHWPCHQPTRSVMRSVSDGRWMGVVEGTLIELDTCEMQGHVWLRVGRAMSTVYNCVTKTARMGQHGGGIKGCNYLPTCILQGKNKF